MGYVTGALRMFLLLVFFLFALKNYEMATLRFYFDLEWRAPLILMLLVFFVLLLTVRGGPALLVYRKTLPMRQRIEMVFLTATALPLLVALAEIGVDSGVMLPQNAAALVGAGVLSIAIFPFIATRLHRPRDQQSTHEAPVP